jgi:Tannase and feruloyl esterase
MPIRASWASGRVGGPPGVARLVGIWRERISATDREAGHGLRRPHETRSGYLKEAPTKLDSATVVTEGAPAPYCLVSGYAAPSVAFQVRLPTETWSQRMVMNGCGGYCGDLLSLPVGAPSASTGCTVAGSGELVVASHNGGHVGATDKGHFLRSISDGAWAVGDPSALVDFFYRSNRKATVAVKAIVAAFYGQPPRYSYFDGCSSGGRAALQVAQRYPDDYDGIVAGAPTIDNTDENTFVHGWNVRVNEAPDGTSILTVDKIPALAKAVLAACADNSGMIQDPRACHFDAATLVCKGAETPACLTEDQARVANLIWRGAQDEKGELLAPGGMPYGSELAWAGSTALPKGTKFTPDNSVDYAFSYDFPNFMSSWRRTGVTNANIEFSQEEFRRLDAMHGLNDPTNPDLRAFAAHGGKLIIWQGWADSGTSPFGTLNYYAAVRKLMGSEEVSKFLTLYMIPGMYHCGGGPAAATLDILTPLMAWVEDKTEPAQQLVSYHAGSEGTSPVVRTRPVAPYPATVAFSGQGDVNSSSSYAVAPSVSGVSDELLWAGSRHYRPGEQMSCEEDGHVLRCR